MSLEVPKALNILKYLVFVHLALFLITITLALNDGQTFQSWWAIHPLVSYWTLIYLKKPEVGTFYIKLSYLLVVPSFHLHKFFSFVAWDEVPLVYLVLNMMFAATLYLCVPLLIIGKSYYLRANGNV